MEGNVNYLTKDTTRGLRRKHSVTKALRKRNISKQYPCYPTGFYSNLHQYSKNKIHCSCWMCSFHGETMSDIRKKVSMDFQLQELWET